MPSPTELAQTASDLDNWAAWATSHGRALLAIYLHRMAQQVRELSL